MGLDRGGQGRATGGVYSEAFFWVSRGERTRTGDGFGRQHGVLDGRVDRQGGSNGRGVERGSGEQRTFLSFFFSAAAGVDDGAAASSAAFLPRPDVGFDFLAGGGVGALSSGASGASKGEPITSVNAGTRRARAQTGRAAPSSSDSESSESDFSPATCDAISSSSSSSTSKSSLTSANAVAAVVGMRPSAICRGGRG